MYCDHSTCTYYDHSTCMYDDHSTCMYYDHGTCMCYDHSTCMYYDHSTCMYYSYSAHSVGLMFLAVESRGLGGKASQVSSWFRGAARPPNVGGRQLFFRRGASRHEGGGAGEGSGGVT